MVVTQQTVAAGVDERRDSVTLTFSPAVHVQTAINQQSDHSEVAVIAGFVESRPAAEICDVQRMTLDMGLEVIRRTFGGYSKVSKFGVIWKEFKNYVRVIER